MTIKACHWSPAYIGIILFWFSQIYWKFYHQKNENFQMKKSDIFHISAQNIDCGYSLEPPRRGGSNEYHNLCFEQKYEK